jgi:uncharacterized membrane protein
MSRADWIHIVLFLHVLGAIAALGPTLTYGLWTQLGERATPAERAWVLRGISWVDGHLATPAYMAQAVTGVALILLLKISLIHTAWLLMGVLLYVILVVFATAIYAPVVRAQIAAAELAAARPEDQGVSSSYRAAAARARSLGIVAVVLTVAIVFFMVVKPTLWSAG